MTPPGGEEWRIRMPCMHPMSSGGRPFLPVLNMILEYMDQAGVLTSHERQGVRQLRKLAASAPYRDEQRQIELWQNLGATLTMHFAAPSKHAVPLSNLVKSGQPELRHYQMSWPPPARPPPGTR